MIKRAISLAVCILLVFAILPLSACTGGETGGTDGNTGGTGGNNIQPKNRLWYEYFDTVCIVYDYSGMTNAEFDSVTDFIEDELEACHELFDIYNEYSGINNLATLNKNAGGAAIKVDSRIIDLLTFSKEMYDATDAEVNIAMGAVLVQWHDARKASEKNPQNAKIPSMESLTKASEHTNISSIVIDKENSTVKITDSEARIDVGAIAKGYTAERIAKMLIDRGVTSFVLDFGGNLRTIGTKADGNGWVTGIRNPDLTSDTPYLRIINLKNSSLVTSGTYERYFTVNGTKYHHIIDGDTLMPSDRYASVSIHTESSAIADALSTAVFNMTEDEINALVQSISDVEITVIDNAGNIKIYGARK